MSKYLRWAELPPRTDVYQEHGTTKWGNHDLYPIPMKERTFGRLAYFLYWVTCSMGLSTYSIGSAYIALGLSVAQTIGAVTVGAILASINGVLCGRVGAEKSLGYTMMARVAFGLYGVWIPLAFQLISNVIFFGIQSVYGGQAISLMIGAIFPQWLHMKNTLPESAGTTSTNLIGFFLYIILYFPIVVWVRPHKYEKFLGIPFVMTVCTMFGMLGWAIQKNGGSVGSVVAPTASLSPTDTAFRFFQCVATVCGTYTQPADRFADWTRFSKRKTSPLVGTLTAMPVSIFTAGMIGVFTTSAAYNVYGTLMWNPLILLQFVQKNEYTSACRAGTFFAGLSILLHQLFVNATQNNIGAGMDLAGMFPRYLSMKRASILVCIVGIVIQPWRFLTQASTFVSVISSFAVMAAVTTGILIADYWIVRKQIWKVPDLYKEEGIYWFTKGVNLRSATAFFISITPSMPGMVFNIMGKTTHPSVRIYQLTYIVGFVLSFVSYATICRLWPPEGLGIREEFLEMDTIDGIARCWSTEEKKLPENMTEMLPKEVHI